MIHMSVIRRIFSIFQGWIEANALSKRSGKKREKRIEANQYSQLLFVAYVKDCKTVERAGSTKWSEAVFGKTTQIGEESLLIWMWKSSLDKRETTQIVLVGAYVTSVVYRGLGRKVLHLPSWVLYTHAGLISERCRVRHSGQVRQGIFIVYRTSISYETLNARRMSLVVCMDACAFFSITNGTERQMIDPMFISMFIFNLYTDAVQFIQLRQAIMIQTWHIQLRTDLSKWRRHEKGREPWRCCTFAYVNYATLINKQSHAICRALAGFSD